LQDLKTLPAWYEFLENVEFPFLLYVDNSISILETPIKQKTNMQTVVYPYAFDTRKCGVMLASETDNCKDGPFSCLDCGRDMKLSHHGETKFFQHTGQKTKGETTSVTPCSGETVLHRYAKLSIKENLHKWKVELSCPICGEHTKGPITFQDMKAKIECRYMGRIPDVLVQDKNRNISMDFEVKVSHKKTREDRKILVEIFGKDNIFEVEGSEVHESHQNGTFLLHCKGDSYCLGCSLARLRNCYDCGKEADIHDLWGGPIQARKNLFFVCPECKTHCQICSTIHGKTKKCPFCGGSRDLFNFIQNQEKQRKDNERKREEERRHKQEEEEKRKFLIKEEQRRRQEKAKNLRFLIEQERRQKQEEKRCQQEAEKLRILVEEEQRRKREEEQRIQREEEQRIQKEKWILQLKEEREIWLRKEEESRKVQYEQMEREKAERTRKREEDERKKEYETNQKRIKSIEESRIWSMKVKEKAFQKMSKFVEKKGNQFLLPLWELPEKEREDAQKAGAIFKDGAWWVTNCDSLAACEKWWGEVTKDDYAMLVSILQAKNIK
jgi:hypothetical protein